MDNSQYLGIEKDKRKELVAFVIGGPNKYYKYSEKQIHELFNKVKTLFTPDRFKIIATLAKKSLTDTSDVDFVEVIKLRNGELKKLQDFSVYNELEKMHELRRVEELKV